MKICILGGGVTGLSVARLLDPARFTVRVLERASVLGGLCRSSVVEGFTCDHAGGHIVFSKNKAVLDWMLDHVGRDNTVEKDRNTRIRWHDRYVPYPFENGVGHLTPEAKFDCLKGYLEAAARRERGEPCPTDFENWVLWKMGRGFAEHFMFPYNRKLWECDLSKMASAWVAGRVPDAPVDDILKAAVGLETKGYVHQAKFWFPLTGGFQALTDGIARACPHEILTDTPCESLRRSGDGWVVNGEEYDFVVNTMPLPELAKVFKDLPGGVRGDIDALVPISLVNVLVAMKVDRPLDDLSWIYLPFEDQGPANRITFYSNYSPRNAPEGHASYMAEITYRGHYDFDAAKEQALLQGLEHAGLVRRSDVVLTHHWHNRYAYIDQDLEFAARIARVRSWFDASGMLTLGRFGRYEYHNSDQCIERAFQAVEQIEARALAGDRMTFEIGA
ncbi:MAG: FAD-dependent oxidoreductase [Planctomycetes bacterium]|nr:FAD-dependent oxidoreductase [Planctomycetota bacterium]